MKITWDALPNRSWTGKTEVIPKQVVARGTRSVGELLCAVNNDKLELLPNINVNVTHQFEGTKQCVDGAARRGGCRGRARFVFVVMRERVGRGVPAGEPGNPGGNRGRHQLSRS